MCIYCKNYCAGFDEAVQRNSIASQKAALLAGGVAPTQPSGNAQLYRSISLVAPPDLVDRIYYMYLTSHDYGAPIFGALNTLNPAIVEAVCKISPESCKSEDDMHVPALYDAASQPGNSAIVELLLKHGADPNGLYIWFNVATACLSSGMPASTFERLFDAGWECNSPSSRAALVAAVGKGRRDVVEVMLRRGGERRETWLPARKELVEAAEENGDGEMVEFVKRKYPRRFTNNALVRSAERNPEAWASLKEAFPDRFVREDDDEEEGAGFVFGLGRKLRSWVAGMRRAAKWRSVGEEKHSSEKELTKRVSTDSGSS